MNKEFTQQVISEPQGQDPDFLDALSDDPSLKAQQAQQIAQDNALQDFFNSAPAPSADHLAKIHAIADAPDAKQWSIKHYVAMAASLVLCVLSLKYIDAPAEHGHNHHLVAHSLNHAAHGHSFAGIANTNPTLSQVNHQLASYGAKISNVDNLVWNKNCDFEGITSAHLVYRDQKERINVYIVPDSYEFSEIEHAFSDERYQGIIKKVSDNYLVIVAPKSHDLEPVSDRIVNDLHWSI